MRFIPHVLVENRCKFPSYHIRPRASELSLYHLVACILLSVQSNSTGGDALSTAALVGDGSGDIYVAGHTYDGGNRARVDLPICLVGISSIVLMETEAFSKHRHPSPDLARCCSPLFSWGI